MYRLLVVELMSAIVSIPKNDAWDVYHTLKPAPGCTLLGGVGIKLGDISRLAALQGDVGNASTLVKRVLSAPPSPDRDSDDDII